MYYVSKILYTCVKYQKPKKRTRKNRAFTKEKYREKCLDENKRTKVNLNNGQIENR